MQIKYIISNTLTPWSRAYPEKLIVAQLVKKYLILMEHKGSLPCSQQPATGPYPEPDESIQHLPILFPQD